MSKILHANWNADFAMDDEHAKPRMKETTNELASLISSWNLRVKNMPIVDNVQLAGEEQHDRVGGFGMRYKNPFTFSFE